jgi:hypothetical protein
MTQQWGLPKLLVAADAPRQPDAAEPIKYWR